MFKPRHYTPNLIRVLTNDISVKNIGKWEEIPLSLCSYTIRAESFVLWLNKACLFAVPLER